MPTSEDVVVPQSYDPKVHRKSIEDPGRSFRRSSIPFADRKPAVRFIRSVDLRKRSIAGPNDPKPGTKSQKPILKKTNYPILVEEPNRTGSFESHTTTNDDLENCKFRAEIIMDKLTRADRIGRGSMDVLTFPTSTRRVDPLSRYQGCMTVCVCIIDSYTESLEQRSKQKSPPSKVPSVPSVTQIRSVIDIAHDMYVEAQHLHTTARKFYSSSKQRYNEWDDLLKRNSEFKLDHCKLKYPIYSSKKMPESVTLYEDALEELMKTTDSSVDGYLRISRSYPEGLITLNCDLIEDEPNEKTIEPISFHDSKAEIQVEVMKGVANHAKDLITSSESCLKQGIELLTDKEMDESFSIIQNKINSLEFDDYFDPLCALELKNALGEVVARKAELLNTAEQILEYCKWVVMFTHKFYRFTKRRIKGSNFLAWLCCCEIGLTPKKLLQILGIVSVEDVNVLMPLTVELAMDVFHLNPYRDQDDEGGGGEVEHHPEKAVTIVH